MKQAMVDYIKKKKISWKDDFPKENRYFETKYGILYNADVLEKLKELPNESVDCVITSPPYWGLRDYGVIGQIGLEKNIFEYLEKLWLIYDEVYRILKPTGTCWVNLGDTYNNKTNGGVLASNKSKLCGGRGRNPKYDNSSFVKREKQKFHTKSLLMIPERFAIGMIERGWVLRNQIIWHKPNAMPESVKDRFTKDFEKIFFFVKNKRYYFNQIKEPNKNSYKQNYYGKTRNKRTVWTISTKAFKGAHFAAFPPEIPEICMSAGCPEDGIVLDIFMGVGTTAIIAEKLNCKWIGIELNPEYCSIMIDRIEKK